MSKHAKPTTNYFDGCKTGEDLKKTYHKLALKFHPDLNKEADATARMQEINAEFDYLIEAALRTQYEGMSDEKIAERVVAAEHVREAIDAIVFLPQLDRIEVLGDWVWVWGETKPIKEYLKEHKFSWCPGKEGFPWVFKGRKSFSRRRYNLDEIRELYQSQVVQSRPRKAVA